MENQNQPKSEPTTGTRNECQTVLREIEMLRKSDLSGVSVDDLAQELYRRQRAGDCVALVITPSDLAEYLECDDAGNTHPGSRVPEAGEMYALGRAFERWQDCGGHADIMDTLRDAWQGEQARHLNQKGGRR